MSAEGTRGHPLKSYRRRKAVLDLNVVPRENRNHEGTSTQIEPWPLPINQVIRSLPPTAIAAEAVDDDVILVSSPRAIAEVESKSRGNRGRRVFDVDSGRTTRLANNSLSKRRRIPPNQPIIDCDTYIISETSVNSSKWKRQKPTQLPPALPPPPPPPAAEPAVSCPICMNSLIDEWVSTKCGHIFCKACISQAIAKQAKCPTCRKKVTKNALLRVFLPSNR